MFPPKKPEPMKGTKPPKGKKASGKLLKMGLFGR